MASTVVRDRTVSVVSQEEHLVLEGIGTQRPAMAEDDGLTAAPVFVVKLRSVVNRDVRHGLSPCQCF
jgi:hypothetical protein